MSNEIYNPCGYTIDDINCGFKCNVCGMLLFLNINTIPHENKPKVHFENGTKPVCNSYYFEKKLKWMESQVNANSGKLYCPKCRNKIGQYNWSGDLCSCGTYVTPYFAIHKKKLDIVKLSKNDFMPEQSGQ